MKRLFIIFVLYLGFCMGEQVPIKKVSNVYQVGNGIWQMEGQCTFNLKTNYDPGVWTMDVVLDMATTNMTVWVMNKLNTLDDGKRYQLSNKYDFQSGNKSINFHLSFGGDGTVYPNGYCYSNNDPATTASPSTSTSSSQSSTTTTTTTPSTTTTTPSTTTTTPPTTTTTPSTTTTTPSTTTTTVTTTTLAPSTTVPVTTTTSTGSTNTIPIQHNTDWYDGNEGNHIAEGVCKFPISETVNTYHINLDLDKDTLGITVWDMKKVEQSSSGRKYVFDNISPAHSPNIEFKFHLKYIANPYPSGSCTLIKSAYSSVSSTTGTTSATTTPTSTISNSTQEQTTTATTTPPQQTTTTGQQTTSTMSESTTASNKKYNYKELINKSIMFYEAQRSGKLPDDNRITWRYDSALNDRGANGEDLTGGWYDAGDGVKFNFPMAASTTVLSLGLLFWRDAYVLAGELDNMLECVKWPLDYFLKCWKGNELYAQVGDGHIDHQYWGRVENMTMSRPAFKVDAANGGSDVAGETASAMALGYLVFKDTDTEYANSLLTASRSLYSFAKAYQKKYSDSIPQVSSFYASHGFIDELCESAVLLYMATNDVSYLNDAISFSEDRTPWAFSWDDKTVLCQLLLYRATEDTIYKTQVESFLTSYMPGGSVSETPCGLAWRDQWGSLRYAANAAFIALLAADSGFSKSQEYKEWAMKQIHYMIGNNREGFSYVVGYGENFPLKPHHGGSSCPHISEVCDDKARTSPDPNPNVLYGALVGGPDLNDDYEDDRTDYVKNEVACDYNAGFQSAAAGLMHFEIKGTLPAAPQLSCPTSK